ncbi:hypothetical protein ZIOFF_029790 [Zingiber officinale]|uniref:dUTP diphosphatase n=1 Tax=Zingiber officinale TaxID=94328 RepID=A0A8J5GQ16_ZINOF|nr:hypothetical protein ZIOFF_029790 [Zingiber officinale]
MKIGSPTIEFLGATIGNSKIKLQPHIISKVADFKKEELQTTKGLRSWLGILNYARSYIPNLGKILGPLYSKTSPNGEKRMNGQDWAVVDKVKSIIKDLPELAIPPAQCYVIIEADGCMEGWGGVLKWKPQKYDPKTSELISAYASGKQEEGTLALVVFRDNRWQGDQAIFATMEIDLTHGSQLVYVIPDTMLTISDFYRNIQVSILARGYENWRNGEANLLITRGLVGRLSNTPNVGFAYEIQNVVDYLASHGVRALPGRSYNTRDVLGHNWVIRQSTVNIPMQPIEVNIRNMLDGSVSLQFDQYQAATSSSPPKFNSRDEEIQSDEEELTSHTIAVLVEEERGPELIVKRIHSLAQLPVRRTPGAAGSSTAMRGIIIMGGVIDSDYRGEVKVMAFNTTNDDIFLNKQECIAQLIIEQITTPMVREVELLGSTERGVSGFGSTTRNIASGLVFGCHYCCSDEEDAAKYDEYVATYPENTAQKGKEVEQVVKRVSGYQPLSEEQLLALQKQARQSMDPVKGRRVNYSAMGGSNSAASGQAQDQGSFISGEPYHFLAQYKEVSCSRGPWVCTTHEEDARRHLADIEKTVADQLIHNILELKLIHDIKKADFSIRGEHSKELYFKDALPSVTAVKTSLFNTFLQLQSTIQHMVDTPP